MFLINLVPFVSSASFLRFGGWATTSSASSQSPSTSSGAARVRAQPAAQAPTSLPTTTTGRVVTTEVHHPPRLVIPRVAVAWPEGFTGILPDRASLARHSEALVEKSRELVQGVHEAA